MSQQNSPEQQTKSPDQIAAEQALQAQVKQAEEQAAKEKAEAERQKVAALKLERKKKKAGEVHFVRDGEVYVPLMPKVLIPGIGERTALELCADEESQAFLIAEGCVGTVIEKV